MKLQSILRSLLSLSLVAAVAGGCDSDDDTMESGSAEGTGASGDICEQATEYYESCGLTPQDDGQACEGEIECSAQCALDATCEELEEAQDPAVFLGGGNEYTACILDCAS